MTKLLSKNSKIDKSASDSEVLFNFGIPAYKTEVNGQEFVTCPMAGQCAKSQGCYALNATYTWPVVKNAYQNRLLATLSNDFTAMMGKEIRTKVKSNKDKKVVIRIHDSGDFYNMHYFEKWLQVIKEFPQVQFYAYTKMVPMFKHWLKTNTLPENFTVIYSFGGLRDDLINKEVDRHSSVFESMAELVAAGYTDTTEDDKNAYKSVNGKVGLVYHGAKGKKWVA